MARRTHKTESIQRFAELAPRKPLRVNVDVLEMVTKLAGLGLTQSQMCGYFEIGEAKWRAMLEATPRLQEALRHGKAKAVAKVAGKLMHYIDSPKLNSVNLRAIKMYLTMQAGWRDASHSETASDEHTDKPVLSLVTTNDPIEASRIYQQYMTKK